MNRNTHLGALNQWLLTEAITGDLDNFSEEEKCSVYQRSKY